MTVEQIPYVDDTICAISTPLGQGGIGVIRVSGKNSVKIADRLFHSPHKKTLQKVASHTLHYGTLSDPDTGENLDEVMVAVLRAPRTYTREDVVEISCHGNLPSMTKIISLLIRDGAREALPGEFTKRAFLNGRIDLVQAEAVMDFISAESEMAQKLALQHLNGELSRVILKIREKMVSLLSNLEANLDFAQEEIEILADTAAEARMRELLDEMDLLLKTARDGRICREGYLIALAGRPNAGKSSLLNALLGRDRAIVTSIAGTTRDTLEESLLIQGIKVRLTDTAGLRPTEEEVEREGIKRAEESIARADMVLWIVDAVEGLTSWDYREIEKIEKKNYLILLNKIDLISTEEKTAIAGVPAERVLKISSLKKTGLKALQDRIAGECLQLTRETLSEEGAVLIRGRHVEALKNARESLLRAQASLRNKMSYEFVALDLKGAVDYLGEIVGIMAPDEILNQIFKDFCIGK